ncbi:MAG TPA: hypothetical protein VIV60_37545 [Polyangiaceae bacterium]
MIFLSSSDEFRIFLLVPFNGVQDAVREEIISPLLWALGYSATPPNKIVRSRRLDHPFVALGTTQHRISLVPDYLMYAENRAAWILDAKSPRESVVDPSHEGQAYSYVCHRDVRADWYAICNGREFAAFNVADMSQKPRLRFLLENLDNHWGDLWHTLSPELVHQDVSGKYDKDFGIHLLKMGLPRDLQLDFVKVTIPQVARVGDATYSINVATTIEEQRYFSTFDFDQELLPQLAACLPRDLGQQLGKYLSRVPSLLKLPGNLPCVSISAKLSGSILENDKEHYLPLNVTKFHLVR